MNQDEIIAMAVFYVLRAWALESELEKRRHRNAMTRAGGDA